MPLAVKYDIVTERHSVALSPSLRAALILEKAHGFNKLAQGVAEGSYAILAAIVRECASKDDAATILAIRPIGKLIAALRAPCNAMLLALAGYDQSKPANPTSGTGNAVTFADYYAQLFRVATGNLGWPPSEAYAATPAEIIEAAKGRSELLEALFGAPDKSNAAPTPEQLSEIDHSAGIAQLRQLFGGA